ncbi:helix-turn-helix domain-containing protein [Ruficoccus sp. ZRK36]|uniref:helix-turn-helix domain-containing protein n=1 Tax=Ruficoccus sp. ZRK36 TaxID=2866311 RepID=UPI001C72D1D1|nr:helix-turn-helix domain-containing protein [Ruficoccus sp. ZRK36]QYY36463.1 helix-turn-helix domain-containing protein [Ruficoccus sp. ZRK36]
MEHKPHKLANKNEAAGLLEVSVSTINRMLRDGMLRKVKVRGCVRIPLEDIERILKGGLA